jgi:integrase
MILPKRSKVAPVVNHAALPYADLADFVADLRKQEGTAARALEFTILTAARTGEVIGALPQEFDLNKAVWNVPGERMKARKPHSVPCLLAPSKSSGHN